MRLTRPPARTSALPRRLAGPPFQSTPTPPVQTPCGKGPRAHPRRPACRRRLKRTQRLPIMAPVLAPRSMSAGRSTRKWAPLNRNMQKWTPLDQRCLRSMICPAHTPAAHASPARGQLLYCSGPVPGQPHARRCHPSAPAPALRFRQPMATSSRTMSWRRSKRPSAEVSAVYYSS